MPKVRRKYVPSAVIEHLTRRVRERHVPIEDLQSFARWLDTNPTVPSGPWFKRFAKIIVCGEGDLVKTFLEDKHTAIGMAKERINEETGLGRSQRRTVSEISFHSLRHTATSLLKNAGVPEAVAMDIIGHHSEAISRHYPYIENKAKRSALNKLPKLS